MLRSVVFLTRTGCQDVKGNTALCYAAMKGHREVVKTLLDVGAKANSQDSVRL